MRSPFTVGVPAARRHADAVGILQAGIDAVEPAALVHARLTQLASRLKRVTLVAAGKASEAMARAAMSVLDTRITGGIVVGSAPTTMDGLISVTGDHPRPGTESERAGRTALHVANAVASDGTLLVLISGGASSLLAVPADGLSLADKRAVTGTLLLSGADITDLNTVRKHLSRIKGGRLAAACPGATHSLVLSDVVGDDLGVVASGPTVADASTYREALDVLDRFGGLDAYPAVVVEHLRRGVRGELQETPKPGDLRLARARAELVGGRDTAMAGAAREAERRGYHVVVLPEATVGDARLAGARLAQQVRAVVASTGRLCVIASGETTVRVTGAGRGGRNQELALSVAESLAGDRRAFTFASVGTDGIDGPTDAAGAVVDEETLLRAADRGLPSPSEVFADNNAYAYFSSIAGLVKTGPTGTNVGDIQVLLV